MKNRLLLFVFLICCSVAMGQKYVSALPNYEVYKALKGKPLSDKFSNIESVKVIYDLKKQKLYYFNSSLIRLHYEFVTDYLKYDDILAKFNADNYSNTEKGRDFLLGNLNHIKGTDKYIFELAASDHMPIPLIEKLYHLIAASSFIGNSLQFYANTREKIDFFEQQKFKIPCVRSDYIFNELKYQEVVSGNAVGMLKAYKIKDLEKITPKPDEIIVLDGTPETLPNVKGIILNELQTPLSHLVILGKNRKIPVMALTTALEDSKIKASLGKKVELKVVVDTFSLAETTRKIISNAIPKPKPLTIDLSVRDLVDLSKVPKNGQDYIGSKAQNLACLIAIAQDNLFKVPENAYAIPFYFYKKHVENKNVAPLIEELLKYPYKDSTIWINQQLKKIRKSIKETPIDTALIANLNQKLGSQTQFKNFRFRSSTNAEDVDAFNGAGLYDSKTGILGDATKSFEKAIKNVWASVWNESAYWERDFFGIDHSNCAMGILVHRSFPDELANGVVITQNLFREEFNGITVNIEKGESPVVKPDKGQPCEQFTVYDFHFSDTETNTVDVDYVSQSALNDNKPLLSTAEINKLYRVSKKIERKMNQYWSRAKDKPVDLEFKIVGERRELYIKQVRPFSD